MKCGACRQDKASAAFSKDGRRSSGLQSVCKSCQKEQYAAFVARARGAGLCRCGNRPRPGIQSCEDCRAKALDALLKNKYGITAAQRDALVAAQDGRCAICRRDVAARPAVDHDHATGAVRGILCLHCNTGLGNFGESVDVLMAAIRYLEGGI